MPRKMIRVRNKHTGETTTVSESAFGYFAGDFERVDQQPSDGAETPQETAQQPPQGDTAPNAPTRRTAARNDKE